MFNDYTAINKILKDLSNLIAFSIECGEKTNNENAKDFYSDIREWLEGVHYDIATSDWDEEDYDDDDDEEEEE